MAILNDTNDFTNTTRRVHEQSSFDPTAFKSVQTILCITTVSLTSYGLFLLVSIKRRPGTTNNILNYTNITLLIILSVTGVLEAFLYAIAQIAWFSDENLMCTIAETLAWVIGGVYFSAVNLITLNRLLSTKYPIWYRT